MRTDPKALAEKIEEQVWGEKKTGLGVFFPTKEWHDIIAALRAPSSAEAMRAACEDACRTIARDGNGDVTKGASVCARAIRALPLSPDPGSGPVEEWRPIETAPKGVEVPCLSPEYDSPVMLKFYRYNALNGWRDWEQSLHHPTHWFKLPPPPGTHG